MTSHFRPHVFAKYLKAEGTYAQEEDTLYQWVSTHWSPLSDKAAGKIAYDWIVANQEDHANDRNAASAVASALHWVSALPSLTNDVVIPCRNGYVLVQDGALKLIDADPSLGLRHVLACDFVDSANSAPRFIAFLEQILPDVDVRNRVQEYVGYTLTADARYQRAQLWLGGGANGKGALANIVQALHGRLECVRLNALEGFGISHLIGASLIYSDEVPRGRIHEQLLKSMIAGERVLVDRKYRDPMSVRIHGKWLALGNHLPAIADHSTGFWRRWDVVPFSVTIPGGERDPQLAQRIIDQELSGVLTWALDGLIRLQKRGDFSPELPVAMSAILETVKIESNVVKAWCDDCEVSVTEEMCSSKDSVYAHFRSWCERNGMRLEPSPKFWTKVKELLPFNEARKRQNGTQVRICNLAISVLGAHKR